MSHKKTKQQQEAIMRPFMIRGGKEALSFWKTWIEANATVSTPKHVIAPMITMVPSKSNCNTFSFNETAVDFDAVGGLKKKAMIPKPTPPMGD
jgi:hypothetical protein